MSTIPAKSGVEDGLTEEQMKQESETWRKTAEEFFKRMPPPSIPVLPKEHASDLSKYKNRPEMTSAEAWQKCAESIEQYDADSCKAHREEIDTLLVFAGLFSAVLTAFTIESYQWLQDDPNEVIIDLLSQLLQAQGRAESTPGPSGSPDAVSVRINAYWFLSLTLSLSAALVAILCKQWIREFERHGNQSHRQYVSIRHMKLEGFEGWGVASIVLTIPLLLQSALGLFALGLIELLWNLHSTVAVVVLVPTSGALLFYALTTLLPALQYLCNPFTTLRSLSQCPFKSPQSLLTLRTLTTLWSHISTLVFRYYPTTLTNAIPERFGKPDSWFVLDRGFNHVRDFCCEHESGGVIQILCLPSCFRGLMWLLHHTDQPGNKHNIWLAIWDIVTSLRKDPHSRMSAFRAARYGIWNLMNNRRYLGWFTASQQLFDPGFEQWETMVDAISLAGALELGPALRDELFIQHFDIITEVSLYYPLRDHLHVQDDASKHALVHTILARGVSQVISSITTIQELTPYKVWPTLTQEETCCIIALCFHMLHLRREGIREDAAKQQASSLLQTIFSHLCRGGWEEARMALGALGVVVPALRLRVADGEFAAANATMARIRPAAPVLFEDTIAQLERVYGEVRAREEQSLPMVHAARVHPGAAGSSERPSNDPRGDQPDIPSTPVDDGPAHPVILSHSGTAALHADDAPDPVPHQSGQGTDNPDGADG